MTNSMIARMHKTAVFDRRVRVLAEQIGTFVQADSRLIDVGTGDGQIALQIAKNASNVQVEGIDIMLRPNTHIPVTEFDGKTIPFEDKSADFVSFVDVLHHTEDPALLILEAARVARKAVLVKDHLSESWLDHATLRMMDWVGNAPHGVVLPYNYASKSRWMSYFNSAGLNVDRFETSVPLYPFPFNMVFGRKLHFVARLIPRA